MSCAEGFKKRLYKKTKNLIDYDVLEHHLLPWMLRILT